MSRWPPPAAPPTGAGSEELCSTVPADIAADFVRNIVSLLVVCFASWKVAAFAQKLHLPRGSGFLLTGMLAGSLLDTMQGLDSADGRTMIKGISCKYVIFSGSKFYMFFPVRPRPAPAHAMYPHECAAAQPRADARARSQVNYICMSFIAYATGSELIYGRYKKLLKKMASITFMITLSIYVLCSVVLQFLLASETARNNLGLALPNCVVGGTGTEALSRERVEECRVMEALSTNSYLRWAISLLIGAILTSRSPASAISIVGEMRANGDFTKTALGVTIFMYLGVILLFSITQVRGRGRFRIRVRVSTTTVYLGAILSLTLFSIPRRPSPSS